MIAFTEYPERAYLLLEARQSSPNKLLAQGVIPEHWPNRLLFPLIGVVRP